MKGNSSMTEVYLIRHSKTLKVNNDLNRESLQIQNEKACLSIEGEELAKKRFDNREFYNIGIIFSSNYIRAIETARYLANKNNLEINIVSDFGERIYGVNNWNELPNNFEIMQFEDENYKLKNGESQKEVRERMYNKLVRIINNNKNKRIAIISHSTALLYLLGKWCHISYDGNSTFNGKVFFNGKWNYCETFKLIFDDDLKLINIENIK